MPLITRRPRSVLSHGIQKHPRLLPGERRLPAAKVAATRDLNEALQGGLAGLVVGEGIPLADIAWAHELAEHPRRGRIIVTLQVEAVRN
jgi:hypothetical protein